MFLFYSILDFLVRMLIGGHLRVGLTTLAACCKFNLSEAVQIVDCRLVIRTSCDVCFCHVSCWKWCLFNSIHYFSFYFHVTHCSTSVG